MKYLEKSFSVAVSSDLVTYEEWDRIFGKKDEEEEKCPESTEDEQTG